MDEWWASLDDELCRALRENGPMTPSEIGGKLALSEPAVVSLVSLLAQEGKVRICLVADGADARRRDEHRAA